MISRFSFFNRVLFFSRRKVAFKNFRCILQYIKDNNAIQCVGSQMLLDSDLRWSDAAEGFLRGHHNSHLGELWRLLKNKKIPKIYPGDLFVNILTE